GVHELYEAWHRLRLWKRHFVDIQWFSSRNERNRPLKLVKRHLLQKVVNKRSLTGSTIVAPRRSVAADSELAGGIGIASKHMIVCETGKRDRIDPLTFSLLPKLQCFTT